MVSVSSGLENPLPSVIPFEDWVRALPREFEQRDIDRLRRAWDCVRAACAAQPEESAQSCLRQAVASATVLVGLDLDTDTVIAGLLHDLPRLGADCAPLMSEFGKTVPSLIDGAAQLGGISDLHRPAEKKSAGQIEALRQMILAMARDVRVVFIALARRLVALRTLEQWPLSVQKQVAGQTLALHAPLANRLGILQLKWELEDLSLRVLEPDSYQRIARLLVDRRVDRERALGVLQRDVSEALQRSGIDAQVTGRAKHIYSIWQKMRRKGLGFHELLDIRAVRVLVDTIPECYVALGVIHSLWQPIPDEYDDYIVTPKANDYQSLHTAVVGPEGKSLEVQIRTWEMHRRAELGVAAHWRYKEGGRRDEDFDDRVAWLRELLRWAREEAREYAPMERYQAELFEHCIYVLTPRGDVIDLARGSTPLDFAYRIHTQVGHRCRGAKVNAKMVPLTYTLQTGDRVDILTARQAEPSRDWLNAKLGYLKSAHARQRVRRWFRLRDYERNVADGRALLERELRRLGGARSVSLESLAQRSRFVGAAEFLAAVGRGDITGVQIAGLLHEHGQGEQTKRRSEPASQKITRSEREGSEAIVIDGVGNLLTRLARCCRPAAGDSIVGYITRNRGISVHRRNCANMARLDTPARERLIEAVWGALNDQLFAVEIQIRTDDPQALVKELPAVLGSEQLKPVELASPTGQRARPTELRLTVEVRDVEQMSRVIHRIAAMPAVHGVRRIGQA